MNEVLEQDRTFARSIVLNWPPADSETEEVEWLARRLASIRRATPGHADGL
jgi:hypothetical protein